MTDHILSRAVAEELSCTGPLTSHVDSFVRRLRELGYASSTRRVKLRMVADFSGWLQRRKLRAADVDEQIVVKYLRRRRRRGQGDARTLGDLLELLREAAVVPRPKPDDDENESQRLEREFGQYLTVERGLSR